MAASMNIVIKCDSCGDEYKSPEPIPFGYISEKYFNDRVTGKIKYLKDCKGWGEVQTPKGETNYLCKYCLAGIISK